MPALLTLGGAYHIGGLNTALVLLTIAGTPGAWVIATTVGDALSVRIADRGAGFEVDGVTGSGLADSVTERMRSAGGGVRVSSAPGDGAWVELLWPK